MYSIAVYIGIVCWRIWELRHTKCLFVKYLFCSWTECCFQCIE